MIQQTEAQGPNCSSDFMWGGNRTQWAQGPGSPTRLHTGITRGVVPGASPRDSGLIGMGWDGPGSRAI